MTVQMLPVERSTDDTADMASAVGVDLYKGNHGLGSREVVVAAYRVGNVWKPFPWAWFSPDQNQVFLEVPAGTDLNPNEVLIIG